uniref:ATP synthase protein YMF19 n=1 Tax=Jaagichlorella hainangensis TaxID=445995 RepID=A0A6M8UDU4_9CHLO|nr:ATP synthase protein YMF19 [Jaagichlorella hainangensis]QKJ84932.1 ATP synthase protein YMF19 [Jaagichlorella hainangensis]
MPQLDKVTFLSQFFWFSVFFFGFYLFQLKFFLPELLRILKYRKKKSMFDFSTTFQKESNNIKTSLQFSLQSLIKSLNSETQSFSSKQLQLIENNYLKFNHKLFNEKNLLFLQNVASFFLLNNLQINIVSISDQKILHQSYRGFSDLNAKIGTNTKTSNSESKLNKKSRILFNKIIKRVSSTKV